MEQAADWKILLIDDEEDIREVMTMTLEDAGYRVFSAPNGETGLEMCRRHRPGIVITDVRMPGISGIQVLEAIKERMPEIEVIVVTAFGEMDLAIRALQLDASDFVTKPVSDQALHLALERARGRFVRKKQVADYTRLLEREIENQAKIMHQDKMISLGRLAASVVHEINNPLTGIRNYLRLMIVLLKGGDLSLEKREKFAHYLDLAERETGRCARIASGLLAFSRKSEPVMTKVRVGELFEKTLPLVGHKLELSSITLDVETVEPIPEVDGDFGQLQQCLVNLLLNAVDAMPDGGELKVSAGYDPAGEKVNIVVRDTGAGISEENLPHIFEPFFTTKEEGYGVGLGLSTVFGIVERHGGRVRVETGPGAGTAFVMAFPCGTAR